MAFQNHVNRNYTSGFAGSLSNDGPLRVKAGRIASATGNTVSRAFGYEGEAPATGTTLAAFSPLVAVGGTTFFGVLVHPKHYALYGTVQGGPLDASYDLPQGAEAEFADMALLHAEIFNLAAAASTVSFGDPLGYVSTATTATQNPNGLPVGALVSYPAGTAVPDGITPIPNSRVVLPVDLAASAPGAVISTVTKIQLTQ